VKDHEKRELVDALTKVAVEFGGTQQLRVRIAQLVLPALEGVSPTGRPHMVEAAIVGVAPMTVTVGWTRSVRHNTRLYVLLSDCIEQTPT
jgi:hypothetical protein